MKNIAIIVSSLKGGGAERIAGLLSKRLSKKYQVYLFVCDLHDIVYDYGGTIVNLSINGAEYIDHYIAEYKRKYKIDCAISFLEGMNFSNIRTKGEECVILSERCAQSPIDPPIRDEIERIKRLYNYADGIVAVSHGVKYDLAVNFGVNEKLIKTIYNFIDVDSIHKKMKEAIDPDIESFVGDAKIILNVGRLHEQKNQKKILVQFQKLLRENENLKLIIVGAGSEKNRLQSIITNLALDDYVRIIPYGKNPFPYYRLASLFVLASEYEGLPNVLLEAMTCGVPIVATDCLAGPRELLNDEVDYGADLKRYKVCKRGVLVEQARSDETGETEYLREAIQLLLDSEELRNNMIQNGTQYIREYSNSKILDAWIEVIENAGNKKIKCPDDLPVEKEEGKSIIVYGAGKKGKTAMLPYLADADSYDLLCFAVSSKEKNPAKIFGLPVMEIEELIPYREEAIVLMGVSYQHQKIVLDHLNHYGFKKVVYPIYRGHDYRYYANLCEDAYEEELSLWYRMHMKKRLDWENLKTYNEKLQWLKLHDRIRDKRLLSDKCSVRDFVQKKIGREYLVPLLGCWDSFDQIKFEELPDQFVLRCTHGEDWYLAVHHKSDLDQIEAGKQFDSWMMLDYAFCSGLQMNYKGIEPKIIAEQMLCSIHGEDIRNYKVFVFGGKAKLIQVEKVQVKKPDCLDELLTLSETLGEGFLHVQIEFYVVAGRIYFGRMIFSPGSGVEEFTSEEFALEMGRWIELPIDEK